jgi:hypothetical protein
MSTRSLIGAETDSGIRLVYVHSDGYPDGQWGKVQTLQRLIATHGIDRVVSTLLHTPAGWSSFDGNPTGEMYPTDPDRFELVAGFGVRYIGEQGNEHYATPEDAHEYWDTEYVYVLNPQGILRWAAHWDTKWADLQWHEVVLVGV